MIYYFLSESKTGFDIKADIKRYDDAVSSIAFPSFERSPEMKQYIQDLKIAEKYCRKNSIKTNADADKVSRIIQRILNIEFNLVTALNIPVSLFFALIGVPLNLWSRQMAYYTSKNETDSAKREGKKIIASMDKVINKNPNANPEIITKMKTVKNKILNDIDIINKK